MTSRLPRPRGGVTGLGPCLTSDKFPCGDPKASPSRPSLDRRAAQDPVRQAGASTLGSLAVGRFLRPGLSQTLEQLCLAALPVPSLLSATTRICCRYWLAPLQACAPSLTGRP